MANLRTQVRFIASNLLPKIKYPVIRGPLRGAYFRLGSFAGEGGGASVFVGSIEPQQTAALLDILKPGQILYDVGANVGYYTLLGARIVGARGRVVAIEPIVRNLSHLYEHVAVNHAKNVIILPAACSDRPGLTRFELGENPALGRIAHLDSEVADRLTVSCMTTLDTVVAQIGWPPHLVKIDVEGAEYLVLKGADELLRTAHPSILLSVHSDQLRNDCLALLAQYGYNAQPLDGSMVNATEFACRPVS